MVLRCFAIRQTAHGNYGTMNKKTMPESDLYQLDFSNTEIAFLNKSDKELKKSARLFKLMNNNALVNLGTGVAMLAMKLGLPFSKTVIKKTVFDHFCGGENLLDCQKVIDKLYRFKALTILDYGAESKSSEEDLNSVMNETIRAVEMAASNISVPVVSSKLTGLADNGLLEKVQEGKELDAGDQHDYNKFLERVNAICSKAHELGVGVMIDAEESWMQDTIDNLVDEMMGLYNKQKVIVYNTFQLYRHDRMAYLEKSYEKARNEGYMLGAKLVRGAYLEKERERAEERNYPSPIQKDKAATDKDFNAAIKFCVDNYEYVGSCCACHNLESNLYQAELIQQKGLLKSHPHLNFCQLLGMSDNITFNLAQAGYNVAKYVPYGPVKEVVSYLIRRANENTSVTGEMSRELDLIMSEIKRRGL
jgi:proline dehydrogenase